MGLFNKYQSNNIEQTEQKEKDVLLSLKITLKKKPDYAGGIGFEEIAEKFYDHIEVKSEAARRIWEKCGSGDYYHISSAADFSVLQENDCERTFLISYILNMCNEWGTCCNLRNPNYVKGWVIDEKEKDYIIMRIFFKRSSFSSLESVENAVKNPIGNFLLTQSLIAYILPDAISEKAKTYFRNNLKITSLTLADEILFKKIFEKNIKTLGHMPSILKYEREEDEKKEKNNNEKA